MRILRWSVAATAMTLLSACGTSNPSTGNAGTGGVGGGAPFIHCMASNSSGDAGPCTTAKSGCSDGNTYTIHCLDGACSCVENGMVVGTYLGGDCADAEFARCGWHL
jgi:hypothetical protein